MFLLGGCAMSGSEAESGAGRSAMRSILVSWKAASDDEVRQVLCLMFRAGFEVCMCFVSCVLSVLGMVLLADGSARALVPAASASCACLSR